MSLFILLNVFRVESYGNCSWCYSAWHPSFQNEGGQKADALWILGEDIEEVFFLSAALKGGLDNWRFLDTDSSALSPHLYKLVISSLSL